MVTFLAKIFIKDRENLADPGVRQAYGVLCGGLGILLNVILFGGKFAAGTISGSIAVIADAFNNLSDAGASLITLVGFKLAGQKPDPAHPFGHGRIEYITGLIVSMVIILMGFELAKSSVEKILHPAAVEFSAFALVTLIVAVALKLYMFLYNRNVGKRIDSAAMRATALDSLSDALATVVVLASLLAGAFTDWQIDGWCGVLVSLFIFYAGISAARETTSLLMGQPPEQEFVDRIEDIVMAHPEIMGIHDLVVHNYGPGRTMISLHAEVPASGDMAELHDVIDNTERALCEALGCHAIIHMDPIDTDDRLTTETREKIAELVKVIDENITIHDFRMVSGPTHTNVIFDVVVPFKFHHTDQEILEMVSRLVSSLDGNYFAVVQVDKSYVK